MAIIILMGIIDWFNLDNRELAMAIIFLILFIVVSLYKKTRDSFLNLIKILLFSQVAIAIFIIILYELVILYLIYTFGFWEKFMIKDFIIWFLFSAVIMFMNANISSKFSVKKILKNNIKWAIFLEFIISMFSFSLWKELVMIIVMGFISVMKVFTENNKKYKEVDNAINFILISFGLFVITYSLYKFTYNLDSILNVKTLKQFLFMPLLTILFMPMIFLSIVYSKYEGLFILINRYVDKRKMNILLKKEIIRYCFFDIKKIDKFKPWFGRNCYVGRIKSKKDIFDIVNEFENL